MVSKAVGNDSSARAFRRIQSPYSRGIGSIVLPVMRACYKLRTSKYLSNMNQKNWGYFARKYDCITVELEQPCTLQGQKVLYELHQNGVQSPMHSESLRRITNLNMHIIIMLRSPITSPVRLSALVNTAARTVAMAGS